MYIEILEKLARHYDMTRGVGHTQALIRGFAHSESTMIVADVSRAAVVANQVATISSVRNLTNRFITLSRIPEALMGQTKPLLIDHQAIQQIALGVLREIQAKQQ
jgi:hypothetical protein